MLLLHLVGRTIDRLPLFCSAEPSRSSHQELGSIVDLVDLTRFGCGGIGLTGKHFLMPVHLVFPFLQGHNPCAVAAVTPNELALPVAAAVKARYMHWRV
jgi:hypothetical protein